MFGGWVGDEVQVGITLYTDAYFVRGFIGTRQRRLTDMLNLAEQDFLVLADVVFERLGHRHVSRRAPFAQVNLGAVLFAVASTTVEAVPELRTPKVSEPALISIPPFEIVGQIHLLPERDLRVALEELTGRFIPVTDAAFRSEIAGEAPQRATMVAVNHSRAQILSPYEIGSATGIGDAGSPAFGTGGDGGSTGEASGEA
jgi:hypothetical protein